MIVKLDKDDLVCLLESKCVPYEEIEEYENKGLGHYVGGFHDKWVWNTERLKELSEQQLFSIYRSLKNIGVKIKSNKIFLFNKIHNKSIKIIGAKKYPVIFFYMEIRDH